MSQQNQPFPRSLCLAAATLTRLNIGMSGASVYSVTEAGHPLRYLKITQEIAAAALLDEIARTRWLAERGIRVPQVLQIEDHTDHVAMLTAAVPGRSADTSSIPTGQLIDTVARAMATLHALPATDCPFDETISVRLQRAADSIAAGEVDQTNFEPRNQDTAPAELLARLQATRPTQEDLVVVHGDATLANILVDDDGGVGFVDCGTAGRADRYTDLAVLVADIEANYGADAARAFIQSYNSGVWNGEKARFFSDLYELY